MNGEHDYTYDMTRHIKMDQLGQKCKIDFSLLAVLLAQFYCKHLSNLTLRCGDIVILLMTYTDQ